VKGKSHIGKYVCYGEEDGSFTWGRIKDEGWENTASGEREVFILTDRMTCRVAKSELESKTIGAVSRRISSGDAGPFKLPGPTDPSTLPDYQRFGDCKHLPPAKPPEPSPEGKEKNLPAVTSTPEGQGLVPKLEEEMGVQPSSGLRMAQRSGVAISSQDGHRIEFLLRKYGYDTSVPKASLNIETDVVDARFKGFEDLTDDELFLLAVRAKLKDTTDRLTLGMRNILMLEAGEVEDGVAERAVSTLKQRRNIV